MRTYGLYRSPIFSNGPTKNLHPPYTKFSGFVGDTKSDTVLRGFDEGILRGREIKFLTPDISPIGGRGVLKFFRVTEAYRPHILT